MADFYIPSTKRYRRDDDEEGGGSTSSASSGKSSKSGFYVPSTKGYLAKYEEDQEAGQVKKLTQSQKKEVPSSANPIGDFLGGAAGFAKDVIEATTSAYKRIGEGTAEVVNEVTGGAQRERNTKIASDEQDIKMIKSLGDTIRAAKSDEEKKRAQQALSKIMKLSNDQTQDFSKRQEQIAERTDPIKAAGAIASIGLDVATAGVGGSAVKAVQAGLKGGAKQLAKGAATGGALGAGYGIAGTTEEKGDKATAQDYALNAAFGAGIGAAIPVAGKALKKGFDATKKAVTSNVSKKAKIDSSDVNAVINQAIDEQSEKYGQGVFDRVKSAIGNSVDPLREFAKIDNQYAKANGVKRNKLNADESVEDIARRSAASEREAAGLFEQKTSTGQSAKDLVQKYNGDSEEGLEFNNYTNAKFDLEFREKNKGKKSIQQNLATEDLQKFVDEYEAKNPDAISDLATKKAVNDMAVDYMAKVGAISADEAKQIKSAYKNAVPLERVFPDDLARPEVTGKNIGSIAKQTVIQRLEGGSDIPLSNSFDTMLNRVYKSVSQGNRTKLAQKLLERQEAGLIPNANVVVTAGNKEARQTMRENVQLLNKGIRTLQSKVKISNRQMRRIESELAKLNKEGLDLALKEGGKTSAPSLGVQVAGKLSKQPGGKSTSSRAFFKSLIETDPAQLKVIRDKIATRQPKLAAKLDEVANFQAQIDSFKSLKQDFKDVTAEFVDDPTTGKQVISGLIDGQSYKMEVPPEIAKAVQGLDQQKLPSVLKAFAIAKKPFEVTWTGVLNPVFSAISAIFYDTPMSIINSPQGFRTIGPKAMAEAVKSINSSSEFQKKLAAEGVRPYGGSGASSFIKPDAKMIAAQKNILGKIKYNSTHPESALASLDVWGGKLANMTRTRVARAAYDDALRQAKKAGEDVKDIAVQKRAMENAALAYRTIMPDFDTMSNLTRQINSVVPFYAASTAGTRSLGKALKRDPVGTAAKALTLGIAPMTALTSFSLMQPTGQEFYKDMEAAGQTRTLDDNLIIVLPGASKNSETGKWEGIVKVPLAPEFRALNQSAWRSVRGAMGGEGPGASQIALSLFDTITGGIRTSQNPLIDSVRVLAGEDPRTGERIIKGDMANLPKEEQLYDTTSPAGKALGGILNTSPIQGDKLLGQFGLAGQTIKNEGKPVEAVSENVNNRFTGAFGEKASTAFYSTYSPIKARKDRVSRDVTDLVKQGKIRQARRVAEDFNETLTGKFSGFNDKYANSEVYDPAWDEMMSGLIIKTSERAFDSRAKQ